MWCEHYESTDALQAGMAVLQMHCACMCAADTLRVHVCQCGCEHEFVNVRYRREWQCCKYTPRACVPMWMRIRQRDVATDALQAGTAALKMYLACVCVNVNVDLCM